MSAVSMKSLLEAGVHFGHQTRRWNPKMRPYIFTERNGIYIIDLQRTLREIEEAYNFVREATAKGGQILFVGTKKQAQEAVQSQAERSGMPYVNQRWLGGMLTNYVTMRGRVDHLIHLETMEEDGTMAKLPKKEQIKLHKEMDKLKRNLTGVRHMKGVPAAVFVIDTKKEAIAVAEARRLKIPLIGIVDTNADPDEVDYVIPGNDDAIRAIALMCQVIGDAALEGRVAAEGPAVAGGDDRPVPKVVDPAAEVAPAADTIEPPAEEEAPSKEEPPAEEVTSEEEVPAEEETPSVEAPAEEIPAVLETEDSTEEAADADSATE